jgi:diguanylate cyclase (GGDEF)-like protein
VSIAAAHPHRRKAEPAHPRAWLAVPAIALLAWGRSHRRVLSPVLDGLCVGFIVCLYLTEQTTLYLHLVYVSLSLGAFIRGGGLPTLARSSAYTAVMIVYMLHISATDDFLEIPFMWGISLLAAGLAQVGDNAIQEQRRMAASDHLTHLDNRREFDRRLSGMRSSFAILAVDVDDLKQVNDKYGHESGDEVLCAVARGMQRAVRSGDAVARIGGDEFAAILQGATPADAADIAERVREAVASERVSHGSCSVSVGWATADQAHVVTEVLHRADQALYRAKRAGRNRVEGPLAA